jgi:putative flippase GtrA
MAPAVSFLLNLLVLHAALGLNAAVAQAVALGSCTVSFYLLSRFLVFRGPHE